MWGYHCWNGQWRIKRFLSFYLNGGSNNPPEAPWELIFIQSRGHLCGSARSPENHAQVRALSGGGAVVKAPRPQELREKPGLTENNLWASLFQVMQLWKRNLPPRHLRRQVIGHQQHLGAGVICHKGFFFRPLDWPLVWAPERPAPSLIQALHYSGQISPQEALHSLVPYPLPLFVFSSASLIVSLALGISYGIMQD